MSRRSPRNPHPSHCAMEALEGRLLLSATLLEAGQKALLDFDLDGTHDAVLANTGSVAVLYEQTGADGLAVTLVEDGASFATNTWAVIGDGDPADDFDLISAVIGKKIRYQCHNYDPIGGQSILSAASIGCATVGVGDVVFAEATEGAIDRLVLDEGDLHDASAVTGIGCLCVDGSILGSILSGGGIGCLSAEAVNGAYIEAADVGTIVTDAVTGGAYIASTGGIDELLADTIDGGAYVSAAGKIDKLRADVITGAAYIEAGEFGDIFADAITGQATIFAYGGAARVKAALFQDATLIAGGDVGQICAGDIVGSLSGTTIAVGGYLGKLSADTITGGTDYASASISVGAGAGRICANTITGGVNGILDIAVDGGLSKLSVGLLEGGQTVEYGYSGASVSVTGDVGSICAGLINGGSGNGFAMLSVNVYAGANADGSEGLGDVGTIHAAAITGGQMSEGGDAMVMFNIGNDLGRLQAGQIIGSGSAEPIGDPTVMFNVGHDIGKVVAGRITAGTAVGDVAYASVQFTAGNDIGKVAADVIEGGTAEGQYAMAEVLFTAGRDIGRISANRIMGGIANGEGAEANVIFDAGRNIDAVMAGLITGTRSNRRVRTPDPAVRFLAGGDIGMVLAGRIEGGQIAADDGNEAIAAVSFRADGTYIDADGIQSAGNIEKIIAGTISGGQADGQGALSYVKISAANDIGKICADAISGGESSDGGFSYVNILAEHDILCFDVGTLSGSGNPTAGCDPAVQIQAYNDIKNFFADRIIAGDDGVINILAGIGADGEVSGEVNEDGEFEAGSIERMVVGFIDGDDGVVNIAAGGDIDLLKVCRVVSGNDGEVTISAGGDINADVWRVRSWTVEDSETGEVIDSGVQFNAGGEVNDRRNRIRDDYVNEGAPVSMPEVLDLPEA